MVWVPGLVPFGGRHAVFLGQTGIPPMIIGRHEGVLYKSDSIKDLEAALRAAKVLGSWAKVRYCNSLLRLSSTDANIVYVKQGVRMFVVKLRDLMEAFGESNFLSRDVAEDDYTPVNYLGGTIAD
jgi:hypothetical protein